MGHQAGQQRTAPDHAHDHADQDLEHAAVEDAARQQVGRVAEDDAAGADGDRVGGSDQPRAEPADDDHDRGHEGEPAARRAAR